ncbi:hypothetical protein NC652_038519 [Populus alba x Populus x berolinensis]|nr:hypothetical protein NC652_038519 [Populus alba x Populus x berolinensis]
MKHMINYWRVYLLGLSMLEIIVLSYRQTHQIHQRFVKKISLVSQYFC